MKKLSIIIAVYNTPGNMLRKCIESALKQTYKNIEVIIVDDGSVQSCSSLCDTYSNRYNVHVLHKKNGGLISARMYGLKFSSGDFFTFLDSDDWVDTDYYERMLDVFCDENVDVSIGGYIIDESNGNEYLPFKQYRHPEKLILSGSDALYTMLKLTYFGWSACDKIYRSEYKKYYYDWWYNSGYGEDMEFNWKVFNDINKVVSQPLYGYHYYMNPMSMMHEKYDKKFLVVPQRMLKMIDETNSTRLIDIIWDNYLKHLIRYSIDLYVTDKMEHKYLDDIHDMLVLAPKNKIEKLIDLSDKYKFFCRETDQIIDDYVSIKTAISHSILSRTGIMVRYIYGAGYIGKMTATLLEAMGIEYNGFVVSKSEDCKDALMMNRHVYALNDISADINNNNILFILALNESNKHDVIMFLNASGYSNNWVDVGKYMITGE